MAGAFYKDQGETAQMRLILCSHLPFSLQQDDHARAIVGVGNILTCPRVGGDARAWDGDSSRRCHDLSVTLGQSCGLNDME